MIRVALLLVTCGSICFGIEVPEGARLEVRLRHGINSFSAIKGMPVEAVLIAPVLSGDKVLIPSGTLVHGTLTEAHRVGMGLYREHATLHMDFKVLELPDGTRVPFESRVAEIENAREQLDKKGTVRGIRSTHTPGFRAAGVLTGLAAVDPIALIFSTAAFSTMLRFSDPEIRWRTGAELVLHVNRSFNSGYEETVTTSPVAITSDAREELSSMIRRMPYQTRKPSSGKLSDLTNLVFFGDRSAIERAFLAAGWVRALDRTAAVRYRTLRAIAESQGFEGAPMSSLLLEDESAVMSLSKSLDTFSKRHHLRIYEHNETWDGRSVFTASATQDTGIVMSVRQHTVTHKIDERIDQERSKVFNDLYFTGCVDAAELVERPWVIEDAHNGSGQSLKTDRAVAVLHINDCESPRRFDETNGTEVNFNRANPVARAARQVILTVRNDVIRGNLIWQGAAWIYQVHRMMGKKPPLESLPVRQTLLSVRHADSAGWMPARGSEDGDNGGAGGSMVAPVPRRPAPPPSPELVPRSDWETPTVELGFTLGTSLFSKSTVGEEALIISHQRTPTGPPTHLSVTAGNNISPGFSLAGTVTVHSNRWMSHELGFSYLRGSFLLGLQKVVPSGSEALSGVVEQRAGLLSRQFSYSTVVHIRPIESRFRPYIAMGPAIQLVHLTDAPFQKARGVFRYGLGNVGMVQAAYNFGHAAPLEGGGIFQPAFQSGGGVKVRMAKCWIMKIDYRNTLSQRPDFLRKSLASAIDSEDPALKPSLVTLEAPNSRRLFAQQRVTLGFAFTF